MAVDNLVVIIIIVVINIQLFLLARVFVMIRDIRKTVNLTNHRIWSIQPDLEQIKIMLGNTESVALQNRRLLSNVYEAQMGITRKGKTSLPIEEDSLRWICSYCFKQEDNLMTQLTCSHCGAERIEPVEEWESVPYFMDGGVSIRPYPDAYPDGLGSQ